MIGSTPVFEGSFAWLSFSLRAFFPSRLARMFLRRSMPSAVLFPQGWWERLKTKQRFLRCIASTQSSRIICLRLSSIPSPRSSAPPLSERICTGMIRWHPERCPVNRSRSPQVISTAPVGAIFLIRSGSSSVRRPAFMSDCASKKSCSTRLSFHCCCQMNCLRDWHSYGILPLKGSSERKSGNRANRSSILLSFLLVKQEFSRNGILKRYANNEAVNSYF